MKHQSIGARRFPLHIQIVYQSCFADEHGEQDIARSVDPRRRLEGLGIHDFRIVYRCEGLGIELALECCFEVQRVLVPGLEFLPRGFERTI